MAKSTNPQDLESRKRCDSNATKHTPGPWTVEHDGPSLAFVTAKAETITGAKWGIVCSVTSDFEHGEANARLIAAAPELLEALEWARDHLNNLEHSEGGLNPGEEHVREKVLAAIAKAKGESQ